MNRFHLNDLAKDNPTYEMFVSGMELPLVGLGGATIYAETEYRFTKPYDIVEFTICLRVVPAAICHWSVSTKTTVPEPRTGVTPADVLFEAAKLAYRSGGVLVDVPKALARWTDEAVERFERWERAEFETARANVVSAKEAAIAAAIAQAEASMNALVKLHEDSSAALCGLPEYE
jgi:hypothetical protein